MSRVATLICISILMNLTLRGQDSLFHYVQKFSGPVQDFTVDNLGNLYLLYQNGQLKKLKPNGDSLAVFNNVRRYGKPTSIDVSNPLKLLLYFRDFGTIVILDRFLNERSVIDLRRQNLLQVRAIGQAYDNSIWIFDELDSRLKKIGDDGRQIDQSTDFRMIFDSAPAPDRIIDQNKLVYLYDTQKGVYIFDYFGGFQNRIPFTGWSDFNVINNTLFGKDSRNLYRYDPAALNLRELPIPDFMRDCDRIIIAPGMVYTLRDGSIMVYSYD